MMLGKNGYAVVPVARRRRFLLLERRSSPPWQAK